MRRFLLSCFIIFNLGEVYAQVTTDPEIPIADQQVTITVDVTGTALDGYTDDVWLWTWIEKASGDIGAPTNVNPATSAESAALMTRSSSNGNIYTITLTLTSFFDRPATDFDQVGILLKGRDWSNGQTPDYIFDVLSGQFEVDFTDPSVFPVIVNLTEDISISAETTESATISLKIDNVEVATATDATQINYTETASLSGAHHVTVTATNGTDNATNEFYYTVRTVTVMEPRPAGIIDGINYSSDLSTVTLSLLAPLKSSVYVVGDFNNWSINPAYQMKQDGEHFWLEITGLTSGQEYGYQYFVDETIWIADPYADKILDPDDKWIPDTTYPNLKQYPEGAIHSQWYQNRTAVLQTNQTAFSWQNTSFKKPEKEKLVVYELLVRDFLGEDNMNYQALIDTLGYLERLGVNAIELMPIMEFAGNDSWGYNPTFMFAVDKAYGTKADLKEFIDTAHGRGMAVILDMVMNQNDIPSPYAQMYFDFNAFKPTAENPWFNVDAKHPYNVFFDINHESVYTQTWLDSINHYWINEFHFDGFRFDLSKGFTQTNSGSDVGAWGQKDDSRIAILERMADAIWANDPDTYVILEHFADNSEEKILSDYGMMLWGNSHWDYKDANLGYASGKSLNWHYYQSRNWDNNYLISYMESHDEQRQMFEMLNNGTSSGSYNIKDTRTALNRLKLSATFFFMVPGPKMIWQFGEFGYDISIDENGRTGRKPTKWEYLEDLDRKSVFDTYKELINLRNKFPVFTEGDFTWQPFGNYKSIHISNADTSVVILGNFDVVQANMSPDFQHTGTWFDFFTEEEFIVDDVNATLTYGPGEYHIYTDKKLHTPGIVLGMEEDDVQISNISAYPNPTNDLLHIYIERDELLQGNNTWSIFNAMGKEVMQGNVQNLNGAINVKSLPVGIYTFLIKDSLNTQATKFIKN